MGQEAISDSTVSCFPPRLSPRTGRPNALSVRVVTDLETLESFAPGWDALAVRMRRPRSAPAFTLAWYRHALPPGAHIRVVIVTDGDEVVGTAPFCVTRTRFGFYQYNLAVPMLFGVEPLVSSDREEEIASAMGHALAHTKPVPDLVLIDSLRKGSLLPTHMQGGWPHPDPVLISPHSFPWSHIHLGDEGFEGFLNGRSSHFRKHFRASYRKLEAAGFERRTWSDSQGMSGRVPDFRRLYEARRAGRAGNGPPFDDTFMAVVLEAAATLSGTGRFRMVTIERPGEVIAAILIVRAGGQASAWYMGFDDTWADLSPSFVNVVLSIEDAALVGDTTFDLGAGAYNHKNRLTDDAPIFESSLLVRRGLAPFHTPAQLVPFGARRSLARALGRVRKLSKSAVAKTGIASSPLESPAP